MLPIIIIIKGITTYIINHVTNNAQLNIYFYKAHLFINPSSVTSTYNINSDPPRGSGIKDLTKLL